jgi:type II secretory pathway component GspD/PulD (secretin)
MRINKLRKKIQAQSTPKADKSHAYCKRLQNRTIRALPQLALPRFIGPVVSLTDQGEHPVQHHRTTPPKRILTTLGLLACTTPIVFAQNADTNRNQNNRLGDFGERIPVEPDTNTESTQRRNEPTVTIGVAAEPIELTTLIDLVGSTLNLNIVVKGSPAGEIVFNAPLRVPRSKLIDTLDAMLELYAFTISYDDGAKLYIVQPITDLKPAFGDNLASTRIIPTPNVKPSLLVTALNAILSPGSGGTNANARSNAIQAVDELGVLIINAPPRDIARIEQMVAELIRIDENQQYIRFELDHLAAPTALNRLVGLVGGSVQSSGIANQRITQNNPNAAGGITGIQSGGSLSNLSERITIDPQGNALIFKGTDNEIGRVRKLLAVIDVPNTLQPRNYFAGSSAAQIADIAKRRGLGEVIQIEPTNSQPFQNFGGQNNQFSQQISEAGQGGPVMVVDPSRGNIIYYGTDDQQAQLAALLDELKTEDERVVIREYVLNHTDALTVADLLNGIISGELQTGDSALLPGSTGRNNNNRGNFGIPIFDDGESSGDFNPEQITVIPDEISNQIIIKAPIKQQEDLDQLITRLDKQRSQVFIKAMIVAVSDNEDFTLAFETQILAGQFGVGTNFGLSTPGATFSDPRDVATNLAGLTSAVIRSDYVPIIVNATQTNSNARILSTPQLLVNDNEESTIQAISEEPFSEQVPSNSGTIASFGGFVEAGTTLTVTPSISDGGFIRLVYEIILSNFTGTGDPTTGSPPPRDSNNLTGSVTVPSNATVVLGGITVEDVRDTINKVPFLGDIPLLGELFRSTNKINNQSKLYVFLTPQIMTDPNFNDLKKLSYGPQHEMGIDQDIPDLKPALILPPRQSNNDSFDSTPEPTRSVVDELMENAKENAGSTSSSPSAEPPQLTPAYIQIKETDTESGASSSTGTSE